MNKIVNKFVLKEDRFMPKLHSKQPGFTYSASGPFTKHHKRIENFRETGNLKRLYRIELDKACFLMMQHIVRVNIQLKELFQIRI